MGGRVIGDLFHVFMRQNILWLLHNLWANTFTTAKKKGENTISIVKWTCCTN